MADRTVKVRLEADISDFVTDIGVKAVAAVNKLERAAGNADKRIGKVGADTNLDKLGTKADAASVKLTKAGTSGETSGKKIGAAAVAAGKDLDKLGVSIDKVDKATAANSKTTQVATKNADAHANAVGRLRVAQLRLAEVQKNSKASASSAAGAEESVAAAERAVKKFEKAGNDSGKSFGAGFKKWLTGSGGASDIGKSGGTVFGSGFLGALKTPILGPAIVALLTALVLTTLPAVGAVAGGAFVTGFGAGIAGLGIAFAAQNDRVKKTWTDTLGQLGRDMQLLSAPFQSVLVKIAGYFKRTVDDFNPALSKAFGDLAQPVNQFANDFAAGLEKLIPAIGPLTQAFSGVLADLGPALTDMLGSLSDGLIELSNSVAKNPQALGDMVRGLGDVAKTALDLVTTLNDVNTKFEDLTGGTSLVDVTMKGLQATLTPLIALFSAMGTQLDLINALTHSTDASGASMSSAAANTVKLAQAQGGLAASAQHAGPAVLTAAEALARAQERAQQAREQFERFISTTRRLSDQLQSLSGAQISFQAAIDAASASVKENGRTLDINTEKGRNNKTALLDVAKAAEDQWEAMLRSGKSTVEAAASATASRASFVKLAVQMGATKPAAEAMARSLISIPNVTREARFTADKKDLDAKIAAARKQLADPKLSATKRAQLEARIAQLLAAKATAQAAIDSLHGKTVALTVNTYKNMVETTTHVDKGVRLPAPPVKADGGFHPGGYASYADGKLPSQAMIAPGKGGGMVQWAEQETGGEAFIPLAPSKRDRSTQILGKVADQFGLGLVKSFANGGINLAGGQLVDIAFLLQQLGLPFNPTAGVNYKSTLTAANRANRAVVPARNNALTADRAEQSAKAQVTAIQRAIQLQQRAITAARAGKPTTKGGQAAEDRKVAAEQAKLVKLQDQLYAAKTKVTKATKASNAADAVYKIRAEAAAKAATANRDALEKLLAQQQAAVDLAKQVSDSLTGGANIGDLFQKSLTGSGLLADLQSQGADLKEFGKLIAALRAKKLDEDLISQIIGKGAGQGTDLASAILAGGAGLINQLNKAQTNLENQANLIGAGVANQKYNVSGARAGGGGVQAGKTYQVNELGQEYFTAPINGHVIPAGQDPRRYIQNMAGAGGGWGSGAVVREVHNHQHNTFNGMSMDEADRIAEKAQALAEFRSRSY